MGEIEIIITDRDGRVIQNGKHEMRSFTHNFARALNGCARSTVDNPAVFTVQRPDGSSCSGAPGYYCLSLCAPDNNDSYGIVVGSGTKPVVISDYNLASKISHGTGSGQLDYNPTTVDDLVIDTSVSPPVAIIRMRRTFTNLSGANVTINEVGLIAALHTGGSLYYLAARDVLPQTYTVPPNATATVIVTMKVVLG